MRQFVIIPSYNPDIKLINLIKSLIKNKFAPTEIIVVNDGSNSECSSFFDEVSSFDCTLINHEQNMGKGQALKTAFSYLLNNNPNDFFAVCADADGQHIAEDIVKCLNCVKPNSLVLGCRQFDDKSIPFRSRFGNKGMRGVFKLLCGISVSDSQTGLRAMDRETMSKITSVSGSRFEYEMNMLIETKNLGIIIICEDIQTIYIEENKTSHFSPVKDSLKIFRVFSKVFMKFFLSSVLGFLVDITLFTLIIELSDFDPTFKWNILIATGVARLVSSLVNYFVNKNTVFVFKKKCTKRQECATVLRYYTVCICQLILSALFVDLFFSLTGIHESVIKVPVDLMLFLASFSIQRDWVFKKD